MRAQDVTQQDVTVGGVPDVQASYHLSSSDGSVYGIRLEVLAAPGKACFVMLSGSKGQFRWLT